MARVSQGPEEAPKRAKMAQELALIIGQDIARRGWPVGERLGSELDMIERYKVSRAVLREAVRILEREDVASMRRGPNGGLFVRAPQASTAVQSMIHYLDYAGVSAPDLYEARRALELRCVELVAERLDEAGIVRLREHLDLETQPQDVVGTLHSFHRLLAELTGNHALLLFVQCATELGEIFSRREPRSSVDPQLAEEIHQAHVAIAEALISGDAAVARHRMMRHLDAAKVIVAQPTGNACI